MPLANALIAELEQEGKSTLRMLERLPLDKLDWTPHPKSMTLGRLNQPPTIVFIRQIMMNHSYHHRGQLSVYLRLLDVPLPAIYGTSADEVM